MRTTLIIRWCLAIICCAILNLSMEAQFQNTYNLPESHDHESVAPSVSNVDNHVVASTLTDLVTGDRSIHVMEVDNLGNVVWELQYNTPNQDRVFHIGACPQGMGYYLSGSTNQGGVERLLVITINALGLITNQATYNDAVFNANSYGLHILKTEHDPQPGYVVTGFETVAPNINAQKEALIMKLDGALNVVWSRHLDTASGNLDYDMGSHVVEADGIGYFLSGSANRPNQGDQVILAAMFNYNGNLMWENQYDDNGGSGHYSVGAGAYYDNATNEIYQLSNLSIIHHFGVNVFNVFTGLRNVPKSYGVFSNLGYYNIQAFRIMESQDPNNLVISGFMRDHNWSEDENGDGVPDTFYNGSVPFAMEVDKAATTIVWDNIYLVPATGYNTNVDIFSAFSAGQQPRILHTEIAWTKQDGNGYVLAAYRGNFPDFETELIELDLAGDNNCSKSDVELQFFARNWYDYQVLDISAQNNFRQAPNFLVTPIASVVSACSVSGNPCTPDSNFSITDTGDCCYVFTDLTPGNPADQGCDKWELFDAGGALIATGSSDSFTHCFSISGTYTMCYTDCCTNDDGTINQSQTCQSFDVVCCDAGVSVYADQQGCFYTYTIVNTGGTPDAEVCVWTDLFGTVTLPFSWTVDFTGFCGPYGICYAAYCCDEGFDPNQTPTICADWYIECCGNCTPDADFDWNAIGDCCYNFFDLTPDLGQPSGCDYWDVYDPFGNLIANGFGDNFTYCFPYTGNYTICYNDCCVNPDGTQSISTYCKNIEVDCGEPCELDANFTWVDLGDCCFKFYDLSPDPTQVNNCDYWEIYDMSFNLVATGDGDEYIFCFPTSGNFLVCFHDCCMTADGTMYFDDICQEIYVDCGAEPCVPDADFTWNDLGQCCYEFYDISPDPAANAGCDRWEIYDVFGNLLVNGLGENFIYCFPGTGSYIVCFTDCCVNADGTINTVTVCKDIWVQCEGEPCVPDADFLWGDLGQCCYEFHDLTPDPAVANNCDIWEIFDPFGNLLISATGDDLIFCFPGTGTYTVCYNDCCLNPDGTFTSVRLCKEIFVDCGGEPCVPDADFTWNDLGQCCYEFYDISPDPANANCDRWEIYDVFGNLIVNGLGENFIYCFPGTGNYIVCFTDCCINADGTITLSTICKDIYINCGGEPCVPDADFTWNDLGQCCYQFYDISPDPAANAGCDSWQIFDVFGNLITTGAGENFVFCFPGTGSYVVCFTDCCINADGTISTATICKDIWVQCGGEPCTPDADFQWNELQDCCYEFYDLSPEPAGQANNCDKWLIYDISWNLLASASGDNFIFCFPGTGSYIVCYEDCCINADGTVTTTTICKDIWVDCGGEPCTPDAEFLWNELQDCCYEFFDLTPDPAVANNCDKWEIYDVFGNLISSATGDNFIFCFPGTGSYIVCYTDCCINADGTVNTTTICKDIWVECGDCIPDAHFVWNELQDCCYEFVDITPDPFIQGCDSWEILDVFGNPIAFGSGDSFVFCFPMSGTYTVCYTDCCINPDGTINTVQNCQIIDVNCGCNQVPQFDWDYFPNLNGQNCEQGFCISTPVDPSIYCATWDFGDGTVENHPIDICPTHTYACDGVYTVCVTVYCCEDPSVSLTVCKDITVDCPCVLAANANFTVATSPDNCSVTAIIDLPLTPCPDEFCWVWDFGDGTTQVGGALVSHTYTASGTYSICLTVFCCDNPNIAYTICYQVEVDCGCQPVGNFTIDVFNQNQPCGEVGFCPNIIFDVTEYCAVWDFGDGTIIGPFVGADMLFCPIHTYDCAGTYNVCLTIYCCEDPSISTTVCAEVVVDCGCKLPSASFISASTDNCTATFNLGSTDDYCGDICVSWDFGDGFSGSGWSATHTYASSGVYTVCATVFCCNDPSESYVICTQIQVDCGCQPVGDFTIDVFQQNQPCGEVGFCPIFNFDVTEYCAVWDFGDGTVIGPFSGPDMLFCPIHTYDCEGTYNVCLTIYCCEDPSITSTVCKEVVVDCGCKLPSGSFIDASSVDCTATFNLGSTDDYCGDICVSWDFGDGFSGSGWSATHTYASSGVYTVCATVFCCNDPSESYVICTQVVVECPPCTPDPTFTISTAIYHVNGQCYIDLYADLLTHDGEPDVAGDQCDAWYIYDSLGNLFAMIDGSSYGNGWDFTYTLPAGCYTICRVECCVNPDGTVNSATSCIDFCEECPCEAPQFDWDYFPNLNGDNCEQGFCISTLLDPNKYCAVWDFGDGAVEYHPVDICPVHTYTCDGVYDVCVTVFCCEDQSVGTTVCKQITVDCPCSIPVNANFNWSYGQDMCTVFTNINLPAVTCPDELCWSWDFGDGTVQIGGAFASHTYAADGIYTVCLNIFCCDNPAMGYTICQEVQIDCGGCPEPCEIFPAFMPVAGQCSVYFFNLSQAGSFTTITGYLWDFGDGNTSTSFDPVHTFPGTGTYTVCLTVYGSSADGNCEQTFCWDVTVDCDLPCPGDTNGDGVINTADLIIVLSGYGQSCP